MNSFSLHLHPSFTGGDRRSTSAFRTPHAALHTRKGFTLIEMLVVIAIIAILAGLMFPAITKAMDSARRSKAGAEVRAIATAVALFYNDHGYMPVPLTAQGFAPGPGNGNFGQEQNQPFPGPGDRSDFNPNSPPAWAQEARNILRVLTNDTQNMAQPWASLNRYNKVYLNLENPGSVAGEVLDPWGGQYAIKLDRDLNGMIEYYSDPRQHRTRSVVVSAGRSRLFAGGTNDRNARDNVANVPMPNLN